MRPMWIWLAVCSLVQQQNSKAILSIRVFSSLKRNTSEFSICMFKRKGNTAEKLLHKETDEWCNVIIWMILKKETWHWICFLVCLLDHWKAPLKESHVSQIVFHSVLCTLSHVAETLAPHKRFQHDIIAKFSNGLK